MYLALVKPALLTTVKPGWYLSPFCTSIWFQFSQLSLGVGSIDFFLHKVVRKLLKCLAIPLSFNYRRGSFLSNCFIFTPRKRLRLHFLPELHEYLVNATFSSRKYDFLPSNELAVSNVWLCTYISVVFKLDARWLPPDLRFEKPHYSSDITE